VIRAVVLAMMLVLSAGCASNAVHNSLIELPAEPVDESRLLAAEIGHFLANAASADTLRLVQSPWGEGITVTALAHYRAASGRLCRRLVITPPQGEAQAALACQVDHAWQWVRPITQGGR
jgi:hypothetical protein